MTPIILCAGLGTRLGQTAGSRPKCLLEIDGQTILDRQLDALSQISSQRPRLVIGTKGECWQQAAYDEIRARSVDLIFNFENDKSHNVYSMWLALREIEATDVLLLDGDMVFEETLLSRFLYFPHDNALLTSLAYAELAPGTRVVVDDSGRVVELGKRITPRQFPWQIHSGILKIGKSSFDDFVACLERPENVRGELEGAVSSFIRRHEMHTLCVDTNAWANINAPGDLVRARSLTRALPSGIQIRI